MQASEVYRRVREEKLIAIVRGVEKGKIVAIAEALYAGGVRLMEVTCNTAGAAEMVGMLCEAVGDKMVVGAGTVISRALCEEMIGAGAEYIVAPDVNAEVIGCCVEKGIAVIPGAMTATEITTAVRLGAGLVKLFPAGPLGVGYVKQIRGPLDAVGLVAVGGVNVDNMEEFMAAGCVGIGIGGALIAKRCVESEDWAGLSEYAREYVRKLKC